MRAVNLRRALALSAAVAALAACTTDGQGVATGARPGVYDSAIRAEVDQQLAQSATRAANALETLAMIQRARTEPVATPIDESALPPELVRPSTVDWSGPGWEVVQELAANIGYSFMESGNRPPHPALVQVSIKDVPVAKAFEDIGLQVQRFATIIVDPNQHRVEFRHETGNGAPVPAPLPRGKAPSLKNRVVVSK